jgi:hypothetical protein
VFELYADTAITTLLPLLLLLPLLFLCRVTRTWAAVTSR